MVLAKTVPICLAVDFLGSQTILVKPGKLLMHHYGEQARLDVLIWCDINRSLPDNVQHAGPASVNMSNLV